jgi:hypothetical protein
MQLAKLKCRVQKWFAQTRLIFKALKTDRYTKVLLKLQRKVRLLQTMRRVALRKAQAEENGADDEVASMQCLPRRLLRSSEQLRHVQQQGCLEAMRKTVDFAFNEKARVLASRADSAGATAVPGKELHNNVALQRRAPLGALALRKHAFGLHTSTGSGSYNKLSTATGALQSAVRTKKRRGGKANTISPEVVYRMQVQELSMKAGFLLVKHNVGALGGYGDNKASAIPALLNVHVDADGAAVKHGEDTVLSSEGMVSSAPADRVGILTRVKELSIDAVFIDAIKTKTLGRQR